MKSQSRLMRLRYTFGKYSVLATYQYVDNNASEHPIEVSVLGPNKCNLSIGGYMSLGMAIKIAKDLNELHRKEAKRVTSTST